MAILFDAPGAPAPTEADANLAREAGALVKRASGKGSVVQLRLGLEGAGAENATVPLPAAATQALLRILDEMAKGNAVAVVPFPAELTTQEAADMLNVSRPYLIQLTEDGRLPCRKVGTHRRVRLEDLLAYRRLQDANRDAALAELVEETRCLGFYD